MFVFQSFPLQTKQYVAFKIHYSKINRFMIFLLWLALSITCDQYIECVKKTKMVHIIFMFLMFLNENLSSKKTLFTNHYKVYRGRYVQTLLTCFYINTVVYIA